MSVLIRGMEMPASCDSCRLMMLTDTNCAPELYCGCLIVFKANPQGIGHRPDYCPLVPAADVRPVVKGEWVQVMGKYDWMVKCSRCNGVPIETSNFCPNCGADMKEANDEKT